MSVCVGNKESLRKLLQLSGVKTPDASSGTTGATEEAKGDNQNFVNYKGSFLDIESLMARLERSEKSRTALEANLSTLSGELSELREVIAFIFVCNLNCDCCYHCTIRAIVIRW